MQALGRLCNVTGLSEDVSALPHKKYTIFAILWLWFAESTICSDIDYDHFQQTKAKESQRSYISYEEER
jgi:hypothetical protein